MTPSNGARGVETCSDQVEAQLKQIRQQSHATPIPREFLVETYTSQGMSVPDANTYIECIKTQEALKMKLQTNKNLFNDGAHQ